MNTERLRRLLSLGPSLILVGVVIVFLAIYALLGFIYFRQQGQLGEMEANRDQLRPIVAAASVKDEITRKEADVQTILKSIPPASLREIDVFRTMLEVAAQTGLEPAEVRLELKGDTPRQKVGSQEYRVITFTMSVSGNGDAVWNLVQKLDKGGTPYGTLILDKASLTLGESGQATMEFKIYARITG